MEFLERPEAQLIVGVAVAVVAAGATAYFYFSSKKSKVCLNPEEFKEFKLVKRTQLSHNVAKFRFELPTPTSVLGLPIGQHISCRGKDSQGEEVVKPYTPTTLDSDIGHFELVIKMYPQGRMSHHFREMRVGDYLVVKGPKVISFHVSKPWWIELPGTNCWWEVADTPWNKLRVCISWLGHGGYQKKRKRKGYLAKFHHSMCYGFSSSISKGRFKYQPGQVRAFGMLAGGSGITPMFQVARAILENPTDKTKVHLIYANVTYEDILLKEELEGLAANYPDRFKVYYVLNQPPEVWSGGVGFVSKEMIQTHCPAPAADIKILRCGPPPMNKAMAANLEALGYTPEMQFQF
ncbi:NADH--cytochrome b5 reductase 1 isoform X1 [Nicotiana tabacum]|uniref:NADH--cytochrome b5 reductase 1 isoform X1 n=2 Tax=Nicotiana tabacum TaxID=4097 RepID=A0AC58UKN8_TOBAC